MQDPYHDQYSQQIEQLFNRLRFELKKKQDGQKEQVDANSQKIEELEKIIFQLKIDNQKKQSQINELLDAQKKFTNDIIKLQKILNTMGKSLPVDPQTNQIITLQSYQQSQMEIDVNKSINQKIQKEIIERFNLIKEVFLKKSEFLISSRKLEEQIEKLQIQLNSQADNLQYRGYYHQENQNMSNKYQILGQQMHQNDIKQQTFQNYLESKGQTVILEKQFQQKQN
ncbi:unnamed protein product [Paramecium sonneborni]|uniref:Uncharacterized protein n=1 Tax=Paramecium sonneborni TaxID=65129 RepID=A0A8S1MUS2_9CILI|nr:unnamed protein product [Paramecium sonneborni]